jgi:hypothetical protein
VELTEIVGSAGATLIVASVLTGDGGEPGVAGAVGGVGTTGNAGDPLVRIWFELQPAASTKKEGKKKTNFRWCFRKIEMTRISLHCSLILEPANFFFASNPRELLVLGED